MFLYNITLQRATGISHAIHGNFSGKTIGVSFFLIQHSTDQKKVLFAVTGRLFNNERRNIVNLSNEKTNDVLKLQYKYKYLVHMWEKGYVYVP